MGRAARRSSVYECSTSAGLIRAWSGFFADRIGVAQSECAVISIPAPSKDKVRIEPRSHEGHDAAARLPAASHSLTTLDQSRKTNPSPQPRTTRGRTRPLRALRGFVVQFSRVQDLVTPAPCEARSRR